MSVRNDRNIVNLCCLNNNVEEQLFDIEDSQ